MTVNPNIWTSGLPYFPESELRCQGSGQLILDRRFAATLPMLRERWGRPLTPTSVCRSPDHNKAEGGHWRSMHLTANAGHAGIFGTAAADLYWGDWSREDQVQLYRLALSLGLSCGLHPTFLHVDLRRVIGYPVVTFHYPSWDRRFPDQTAEVLA